MFDHYPHQPSQPQSHYEWNLSTPLAQIIRIPVGGKKDPAYKNLVCTDEDKALIFKVITTIADENIFTLSIKQKELRRIEEQINHVHPLKFLETIFSNPILKEKMILVFSDYPPHFKRNGFMEGLGPSLTREASKGKLLQYIDDFAEEVGVDSTACKKLYEEQNWSGSHWTTKDWEKLVEFLLRH